MLVWITKVRCGTTNKQWVWIWQDQYRQQQSICCGFSFLLGIAYKHAKFEKILLACNYHRNMFLFGCVSTARWLSCSFQICVTKHVHFLMKSSMLQVLFTEWEYFTSITFNVGKFSYLIMNRRYVRQIRVSNLQFITSYDNYLLTFGCLPLIFYELVIHTCFNGDGIQLNWPFLMIVLEI